MDLDRFKEVNDALGHYSGDVLLKELGGRIKDVLRAPTQSPAWAGTSSACCSRTSPRQSCSWEEQGLTLSVAVNLSIRNLLDVTLPRDVGRLLERHRVDPHRLELETTESTMLADPLRTKCVLENLSDMGLRLSLDDFGTGYSSLSYLKRLPLDQLKIDRSFVLNMLEDTDHAVIVRSTIDLAKNLGLEVVAEGVQNAAIWEELGSLGCDVAQGHYLTTSPS
jgi:EAL domain-containing protein (putative c-di-GMP-specific phosphodiesterase class I)